VFVVSELKSYFDDQANEDVQEGITDEDYDLFYEIWQEFDPKGTQYITYDHLNEFLDVLEQPLRIPMPNKFRIIALVNCFQTIKILLNINEYGESAKRPKIV
jgi:hypothetical protein